MSTEFPAIKNVPIYRPISGRKKPPKGPFGLVRHFLPDEVVDEGLLDSDFDDVPFLMLF